MAYDHDLSAAADRHYQDGCKLLDHARLDNAGYHFGLAAECAIKQALTDRGITTDDPAFWEHFPAIKASAVQALRGRSAASVRKLLERDNFMQRWDIRMRYAATGAVERAWVERWRDQANEALGLNYQ